MSKNLTDFQNYLLNKFGVASINDMDVEYHVNLAATLDRLLTELGYDYEFIEELFRFDVKVTVPKLWFGFNVSFLVSPPYIIVGICPDIDISEGNFEAVSEAVNQFRNSISCGTFTVDKEDGLIFFAYTDWYGTYPEALFIKFFMSKPINVWLTYLSVVLDAAEGIIDAETAKNQIQKIRIEREGASVLMPNIEILIGKAK